MGKIRSAKGKSKKITWKRIQHPDVDNFFVEKGEDERLGLKDKADDQLFFIDGDDDYSSIAAEKKRKEEERRGRGRRNKEGPLVDLEGLKCFNILKPDSAVKDPVIKRNPIKKGLGLNKTKDMKLKDELRYFRQEQAAQEIGTRSSLRTSTKKQGHQAPAEFKDLWGEEVKDRRSEIMENEWLEDETKRNILRRPGSLRKPAAKQGNAYKAVEVPHAGLSVNPSFLDHQEIVKVAVQKAQEKVQKEKKIMRATKPTHIQGDGTLPEIKDEEGEEEEEEEDDDKGKVKKLSKPKTKQQKRKEKEKKEGVSKKQQLKETVKKESQVFRIKSLKKELDQEEADRKTRLQKRIEKKKQAELYGVRALSKFKFQENQEQPLLSDELSKGLVSISGAATSADLLVDRFKSLQKRNVIETRVKQRQKPKHKPKVYVRDSDKMEWEKTGMWNGEKVAIPDRRIRRKRNH